MALCTWRGTTWPRSWLSRSSGGIVSSHRRLRHTLCHCRHLHRPPCLHRNCRFRPTATITMQRPAQAMWIGLSGHGCHCHSVHIPMAPFALATTHGMYGSVERRFRSLAHHFHPSHERVRGFESLRRHMTTGSSRHGRIRKCTHTHTDR